MLLDNLLIRVKEYNQSLNDTKIYNKNQKSNIICVDYAYIYITTNYTRLKKDMRDSLVKTNNKNYITFVIQLNIIIK